MNIPDNLNLLDELSPEELMRMIIQEVMKTKPSLDLIQACINAGASPNTPIPLHRAAWYDHLEAVNLLINSGWDVDTQNDTGWTALHWAARFNNPRIITALLQAGASIDLKDHWGYTPLDLARFYNHPECMHSLLQANAPLD